MKQRMLFAAVIMLAAILVSQAEPARAQNQHNVESEIRAAETSRFRALTEADLPTLERVLSEDLVYTHASGWRQTKAEFLASVLSGELLYHSFASDKLRNTRLRKHCFGDGPRCGQSQGERAGTGRKPPVSGSLREARRPVAASGLAIDPPGALERTVWLRWRTSGAHLAY